MTARPWRHVPRLGDEREVSSKALYEGYTGWCTQMDETLVSQKALATALQERGCTSGRKSGGRLWCGITLKEEEPEPLT
jgi:hypothetical protein